MGNYYGSHRDGKDCPCDPQMSAQFKNGTWSAILKHNAPVEELDTTDAEVQAMVTAAMREYNGEVTISG